MKVRKIKDRNIKEKEQTDYDRKWGYPTVAERKREQMEWYSYYNLYLKMNCLC